jgi:hypothetical protein
VTKEMKMTRQGKWSEWFRGLSDSVRFDQAGFPSSVGRADLREKVAGVSSMAC